MAGDMALRTQQVLRVISQLGKPTLREISERMNDGKSITANVIGLQRIGYIEGTSKADVRTYQCTERGLRHLRSMDASSGEVAAPRSYVAASVKAPYEPIRWNPAAARSGAMDHIRLPSMAGGRRTFRSDAA